MNTWKEYLSKLNPNGFSFGFCVYSGGHTLGVTFNAPKWEKIYMVIQFFQFTWSANIQIDHVTDTWYINNNRHIAYMWSSNRYVPTVFEVSIYGTYLTLKRRCKIESLVLQPSSAAHLTADDGWTCGAAETAPDIFPSINPRDIDVLKVCSISSQPEA